MTLRHKASRREFLESSVMAAAAASLGSTFSFASPRSSDIIAGAIRWDAWYKQADASVAAQHTLSTPKYVKRAPFFCSVSPDTQVSCIGTAAEMGAEIRAAVKGGLKYWAFDWYAPDSSLRVAWNLYQRSPSRKLINWCGIVGLANLGSVPFNNNKLQANLHEWAAYMQEPNYQKVTDGTTNRPLLYILWDSTQVKSYFGGDLTNVKKGLEYLRGLLAQANLGAPYVVILDATEGAPVARQIGADAISNYMAGHTLETRGSYADLDKEARKFWTKMADTGVPTVPIAQVGWDTRPRQERPVPWEHKAPNANPTQFFILPTPTELATHVQAAADFIHNHPSSCPSKLLLIYSWDECDEGGGLIPTLGDPNGSYLSAIAPVIA